MSRVVDQINKDLIEAMKAKDDVRTSTLRLLISSIKNKQIEFGRELVDSEALEVIVKSIKQRRESIEAYNKGNRADLARREGAELEILKKYLPEPMSEQDIAKVIDEVINATGASTKADMGRVMGGVMGKTGGRADGTVVSRIVLEKLSG